MRASLMTLAALGLMSFGQSQFVAAQGSVEERCGYSQVSNVNPSFQMTNCLLTETALDKDIPPEVVKAIAERESGGWRQFNADGTPVISADNGIGMMQVTNRPGYDVERLSNDIVYNIEAGVEVLNGMFNQRNLPTINDKNRDIIEHWYFAVMAYNGIKPTNSPVKQASGERNEAAYQERVFELINSSQLVNTARLSFDSADFEYNTETSDNIRFLTMNFEVDQELTHTKHKFNKGDHVETTTNNVGFRSAPSTTGSDVVRLPAREALTITGPFKYDENTSSQNPFVWYPVERANGETGYVASSYLIASTEEIKEPVDPIEPVEFTDVANDHWAKREIEYLSQKKIISGYPDGRFAPNASITRTEAAIMLVRANGASTSNRPDVPFKDVTKDFKYYDVIATAFDEDLFNGKSATEFGPNDPLTRGQMAVILQRLHEFPSGSEDHPFTDIDGKYYTNSVINIYHAGVAAGNTTFSPEKNVTRAEFAAFMARAMNDEYNLK